MNLILGQDTRNLLPACAPIAVVVPTYNRAAQLKSCLIALADGIPVGTEVIVVSDGGDRADFPDLSELKAKLNPTVIHAEHGGPSHARNVGLQSAKAPVVAFIDDDCVPDPGWLEHLVTRVRLNPPVAVGGKTVNGLPGNTYAETTQLILDIGERDQRQRHGDPIFFASNNIAFPADALRKVGGFDTTFTTSEDRELCRRWLRAGFGLIKAPDAVVAHSPRMDLRGFWNKCLAYGSGAAQYHATCREPWRRSSLFFHIRIPALAAAEMSEKKISRRWRIYAMLLVWEVANAAGYFWQKWNNRKRHRSGTAAPGAGT